MRKQTLAVLLLPVLISLGCGSGGGGKSVNEHQFVFTTKGIPDVSGMYSMNRGVLKNNCGAEESPAEFMGNVNVIVTQADDSIVMIFTDVDSTIKNMEASG